jgi:hypothetical protein
MAFVYEQEKSRGNRLEGVTVGLGVNSQRVGIALQNLLCLKVKYSKTCLKRNAMVPVFFFRFHRFPFYKGLCFKVQKI